MSLTFAKPADHRLPRFNRGTGSVLPGVRVPEKAFIDAAPHID